MCGMSEDATQSKNTAVIAKTGRCIFVIVYMCRRAVEALMTFACCTPPSSDMVGKQVPYKEKDMACMPKFTQPLMDRSVVAGYSTAISCSVKGFPRVNTHNYKWTAGVAN